MTGRFGFARSREPSQEELGRALRGATRLRVTQVVGGARLLEVGDPQEVGAFAACLRIRPGPAFHCMCPGDQRLEFRHGLFRRVSITLHHGRSIRWERAWDSDVLLDDPAGPLEWLAARDLAAPRDEYLRAEQDAERSRRAWEAWSRTVPPCLAPSLDLLSAVPGTPEAAADPVLERARAQVDGAYPSETDAVLALLGWFGSGEGPWSGFPSYETVPERLLLGYPTETIVGALRRATEGPQLEGAARLLSSWWFGRERPGAARGLPEDLRGRLLAHAERSPNGDNRARLRAALGLDRDQ